MLRAREAAEFPTFYTLMRGPLSLMATAMLRFAIVLTVALAATWWVLSGFTKPLLLTLGGISIAITLLMCARMRIIDRETAPYMTVPQTLLYFVWLFIEIIKANVAVVKAVLSPDLEISPTMTKIPTHGRSDLSQAMFANSITLTPGTVSVEMADDYIVVHALLSEMSDPDDFEDMGVRADKAVGSPPATQQGVV